MKRPTFLETRKVNQGFLIYYTRKLHKINVWAVSKYGLREFENTVLNPTKPVKQGEKTEWNQVPKAIRQHIIEDYKAFYPSYDN